MSCADQPATAIYTGDASALDVAAPATETDSCDVSSGRVGSISLIPEKGTKGSVGVQVIMGIQKSPSACQEDGFTGGCIVAKRSLSFVKHRRLNLPIELEAACIDIPCGATETCRGGECVSAQITDLSACESPEGCDVAVPSIPTGGASGTGGDTSSGGVLGETGGSESTGGLPGTGGSSPNSSCGNGVIDPEEGEVCDDTGESSSCNADCWPARCGDGVVNRSANEACDDGGESSQCNTDCTEVVCGDGKVNQSAGEECEAGQGSCTDCRTDIPVDAVPSGETSVVSRRAEANANRVLFDGAIVSDTGDTGSFRFEYYFTAEHGLPTTPICYADETSVDCSSVSTSFEPISPGCGSATAVMRVNWNGTLGGSDSFKVGALSNNLSPFTFTNDYSRPNHTDSSWQTAPNIALYKDDSLVWGVPPCRCGNGVLDAGEDCDHAGESSSCDADCTWADCGDGELNASANEECDDGAPSASCTDQCVSIDLGPNAPMLWLDATRLDTLKRGDSGVEEWRDISAGQHRLRQALATAQPKLVKDALGRGRYGIVFDGEGDTLAAVDALVQVSDASLYVVHLVAAEQPTVSPFPVLAQNGTADGFVLSTQAGRDGLGWGYNSGAGPTFLWWTGAANSAPEPSFGISTFSNNGGGYWFALQRGEYVGDTPPAYTEASGPFQLSHELSGFKGAIGELIVAPSEGGAIERERVIRYLHSKWTPNQPSQLGHFPNHGLEVGQDTAFGIMWDQPVSKGAGSIEIRNQDTGALIDSIPIAEGIITIGGNTTQLNYIGLPAGESISILYPAGLFQDAAGNPAPGAIWYGSVTP